MRISYVTKHKLKQMSGIMFYFITLGVWGILVNLRTGDFPLLRSLIVVSIFGITTAFYEIIVVPRLIRKFNFTVNFLGSVFHYAVVPAFLITMMGYGTLVYKHGLTWPEAFQTDLLVIFPKGIGIYLMLVGLSASLLVVIRFSNLMLGEGVIFKYLSGKYHHPKSEEKIFMFLDLKSSTAIAEKLGHEKYSRFLKDFFNRLDEAILETKAFLFQFVGDEIVLIWSYKNGFKNGNAVKFFLRVKEILKKSEQEFISKYGLVPEYQAGIHSGIVSVTEIGSMRKSIAYHGDPINTASRVCSKCKELNEDLLVSEDVYQNIEKNGKYSFEYLGEHELKGKKNKLGIYKVIFNFE